MAYVVYTKSYVKEFFGNAKKVTFYTLALSVPFAFFVFKYIELKSFETQSVFFNVLYAVLPQILAIQFASIIAYAAFSYVPYANSYIGKKLVYLGQISYGLYCYHCLGILCVKGLFMLGLFSVYKSTVLGFVVGAIVSFAITILLAHLSYVYMEKPILRLKRRFV
jgi:peptidoglycan/LPS O-acetylase OafA/YrhL